MIFEKQVVNIFKRMMHSRCDDTQTVFYFSASDFPGLQQESYVFTAAAGHTLQGYLYQYENAMTDRLLVFDHGFGGGHRAYMKEIEMLCRQGYCVFAYDHTGCMESGGDSPNGFSQSLCDLNDCICAIKADARFAGCRLSVMGHSWGAFSTMNITALHPEITHIVAMCGFISAEEIIATFLAGPLKGYRKAVAELEKQSNPYFSQFNAIASLSATNANALLIYSDNDQLCRRVHYDKLKAALEKKANIRFLFVQNKGHNPNYTEEAVQYLTVFSKQRNAITRNKKATATDKEKFVASFDWNKMTEQDPAVWDVIIRHLADES